jgi:hypothetical protein
MPHECKNLKSAILVFLAVATLGLTTACLIPVGEGHEHGGDFHEHGGEFHDHEHEGHEFHPD